MIFFFLQFNYKLATVEDRWDFSAGIMPKKNKLLHDHSYLSFKVII